MNPIDITLRQDKTNFAPHEAVEGTLRWRLGGQAERIDVSLLWYTFGTGTQDVGVVETLTIQAPHSVGSEDFAFALPEGPYSFSGKLISVAWAVEATSSPGHETIRQEIVVSPTRCRISLTDGR
jgi:hypothetical protein